MCAGFPHERQTQAATRGTSNEVQTARVLLPLGGSASRVASVHLLVFDARGGGTAVLGSE